MNDVAGDILATLDDSDLSLILFNMNDRTKILSEVQRYQEQQCEIICVDEKERLAKRMEEWKRENEEVDGVM